jgi:transposase
MARTRRNLDEQGEGEQLLERLRRQRAGWQRERLLAVRWGLEGELSLQEVAAQLGRARSSIQQWFEAFRRGGLEALLSLKRGKGPPSRLTPQMAQALAQKLQAGECRRAADAHRWLLETYGLEVRLASVYHYLKRLGARLKVPRPCHEKHDPAAAETFKATLAQKLAALELPARTPVRLWVADEMRYGLQPVTRRVWALRGQRVVVAVHPRYQWGYVFGALQVGGEGEAEFFYCPTANQQYSRLFLQQIAARDPEAVHVISWDGAGFHPGQGAPELPANVRLIAFPPYSPELNPVEKLWDQLKDRLCNQPFPTLKALEAVMTEFLRGVWQDAQRVWTLVGDGWLLTQSKRFLRQHFTGMRA